MLERASACLDSGVRLSLRAQRRAPKSRRLLHSPFWLHAAGDIDLPACLASSTCPPPQQCPCPRPHHVTLPPQPHHACLPSATTQPETPFLDFLYPAQTLAFMTRVPASHPDRIWDRRPARRPSAHGLRRYSSMTAAAHPAIPSQDPHSPSDSLPSVPNQSDPTSSAPSPSRLAQDLSTLISDNPGGPDSDQTVQGAWDLFVSLRDEEQTPGLMNNLISWLGHLPTQSVYTHVLDLFARLPAEHTSATTYSVAVAANLFAGRVHDALQLQAEGAARMPHEILGAHLLMLHAVTQHDWDMALDIYRRCRRPRPSVLPESVEPKNPLSLPSGGPAMSAYRTPRELWDKLADASGIENHLLALAQLYKDTLDDSSRSSELRELVESIWRARVRFALYRDPAFMSRGRNGKASRASLQKLFTSLDDLRLPSPQIYESVILQLINVGPSGPLEDISYLVDFVYARYKRSLIFLPSQLLLVRLIYLWRHCRLILGQRMPVSTGIRVKVFEQHMERFHGGLDPYSAVTIMDCMARLGNVDGVEEYVQKYLSLHPQGLSTASELYPLVYVHAKRADPHEALNQLSRIKTEFGVTPTLRCWNIVIHAYEEAGDLDGAIDTLEKLLQTGLTPDAFTYGPVMNLYAKQGDVDSTNQLLKDAISRKTEPTVHMLNSVIVAHVNNDDMEQAEQSLEETVGAVNSGKAKGSLTICYNTILTAHALHRNIDSTMATYRRMKNEGIPLDANTYAALVQALCFFRQSDAARRIVQTVMRPNNVYPRAFHYAIVMAGFVNQHMYESAVSVAQEMARAKVRPTTSTQAIQLKAQTLLEHDSKGGDLTYYDGVARVPLEKAIEDFERLCETEIRPSPGTSQSAPSSAPLLQADFLVFIHGKRCAFEAAKSISRKYMSKLLDTGNISEDAPPIKLVTALMSVHLRAREYAEVDNYWELAKSLADAQRLSYSKQQSLPGRLRSDSVDQDAQAPPMIPPTSRFMLSRPLRYYMASQFSQKSVPASSKIPALFSSLSLLGFQFDNRTWNALIVHLCRTTPPRALLAFDLMEKFLIGNWPGWIRANGGVITNRTIYPKRSALAEGVQYLRNAANTRYRSHGTLVPQYKTMVYLAGALLELRSLEATGSLVEVIKNDTEMDEAGQSEVFRQVGSLRDIREMAPKTMNAAQRMPTVYDRLQQKLIRRE